MVDERLVAEPLVAALAAGEAVAFVGAGVSVPSGLPLWRDFLTGFLEHAKPFLYPRDWERATKFLQDGDFLLAAEVLQRALDPPVFDDYIRSVFGRVKEPNDVHRSIARLPFSLVVTANFDTLLEAACHHKPCHTWQEKDPVFQAIRSREFAVVKLHGSIDDVGSLRLTRTDYRDGTYATANLEFNECLRALLTWKTFLFVGYSLRDSDLLRLMDEARMRFGKKFGPHYAIMPRSDVEGMFSTYLRDALSIHCIPYDVDEKDAHSHEKCVVDFLKKLAGRVAKLKHQTEGAGVDDFSVTRAQAAQVALESSILLSGSIRGEVCMISSDIDPELSRVAVLPPTLAVDLPRLDPDSVIHTAFLQASALGSQDYIYIKNVSKSAEELESAGYFNSRYIRCDFAVRSELAYPIVADGRRVGVLNLESDLAEAYTMDHIDVVRQVAERLGQVYLRSEWRRKVSAPLAGYYQHPDQFAELLKNSRLVRAMNHDFLLYEIDYETRHLVAHHPKEIGHDPFRWSLDERSLARQVFRERRGIHIADAEKELNTIRETELNRDGVVKFGITGPLFACPVRAGGQTEAVLVTWLKPTSDAESVDRPRVRTEQWFRSSTGQVLRLANLLANDIYESGSSRAKDFLEAFYSSLEKIDQGGIWTSGKLRNPDFRDQIMYALMNALLDKACGFQCVRVWETTRKANLAYEPDTTTPSDEGFRCVDSLSTRKGTAPGRAPRKAYSDVWSSERDVYCRYTIARFRHDPFAKWQHPAMFGQADANADKLNKDPRGSWIVGPVVRTRNTGEGSELLGFISADSHERDSGTPKDQPESDARVVVLQCRIMDLIAELARHVLAVGLALRSRPASAS